MGKMIGGVPASFVWDCAAYMPMLATDRASDYLSDMVDSELGQVDSANNTTYNPGDAPGSVHGITGTAGTLFGSGAYEVFAMERPAGTVSGAIRFAGEQRDGETNSSLLHARSMHAQMGRILSADSVMPVKLGSQTCSI